MFIATGNLQTASLRQERKVAGRQLLAAPKQHCAQLKCGVVGMQVYKHAAPNGGKSTNVRLHFEVESANDK